MRTFLLLPILFLSLSTFAQNSAPDWLEHTLHGSGKINVVVGVVAVIILGIGVWMFAMDRRLTKLERDTRKRHV